MRKSVKPRTPARSFVNRGIQRIVRKTWPSRNPFGDTMSYKLRQVQGETMGIPIGSQAFAIATLQMNSLPGFIGKYGNSPGILALCSAFQIYQITGVKIRLTFWPLAPNATPLVGFFQASGDNVFTSPSIGGTCEERWSKYKVLSFPGQGCRPTSLSMYYNVNKVYGPNPVTKGDGNFQSNTLPSTPFGAVPLQGPSFRYGIFTLAGVNIAGVQADVHVKAEVTLYIKFYQKIEINQ